MRKHILISLSNKNCQSDYHPILSSYPLPHLLHFPPDRLHLLLDEVVNEEAGVQAGVVAGGGALEALAQYVQKSLQTMQRFGAVAQTPLRRRVRVMEVAIAVHGRSLV